MQCPHCMQSSSPDGKHMSEKTFKNTLRFGAFLHASAYLISGGEPTEHPDFSKFCQITDDFLKKSNGVFSVISNGAWFPDRAEEITKLARLRHYSGMQVYTNKKWYKDYDQTITNAEAIQAIPKVVVDLTEIRNMQDLGRARTCEAAQKEIAVNPYHMSCLNGHLVFRQVDANKRIQGLDVSSGGMMCKPLVDINGDVHLSECWHCPSFGNVNTDYHMTIFKNLQKAKPCYGCALGKKFLNSADPKLFAAKILLER